MVKIRETVAAALHDAGGGPMGEAFWLAFADRFLDKLGRLDHRVVSHPPFTITAADVGRYVRRISTGQVGIISSDPGNGWLHPAVAYEWERIRDDLEYVAVVPVQGVRGQ